MCSRSLDAYFQVVFRGKGTGVETLGILGVVKQHGLCCVEGNAAWRGLVALGGTKTPLHLIGEAVCGKRAVWVRGTPSVDVGVVTIRVLRCDVNLKQS